MGAGNKNYVICGWIETVLFNGSTEMCFRRFRKIAKSFVMSVRLFVGLSVRVAQLDSH